MNRREARALASLLELIEAGVEYPEAEWKASEKGLLIDSSRLCDLYDQHCVEIRIERQEESGST